MSDKKNTVGCGCGSTKKPTPKPEPQICSKCSGGSGVTYFKLEFDHKNPRYNGDCTKHCGLYGEEIDKNFFFLRNAYIYTAYTQQSAETKQLVLERVSGEKIYADIVGDREFDHDFIVSGGSIYVRYPKTDEWVPFLDAATGLPAKFMMDGQNVRVVTDATIDGDGSCEHPLSIDLAYRTGTYAPADFFIDLTCSNVNLNSVSGVSPGHAVVTKELVSRFGCLYNYAEVEKMNSALSGDKGKCGWRVPTHDDWAKLLNSLECPENRDHDSTIVGPHGLIAGHKLKSKEFWRESVYAADPDDGDVLGFSVYGVGSCGDENESKETVKESYSGLEERADYWSTTPTENGEHFTRKFIYCKNEVHLNAKDKTVMLSIRLVRDADENEPDLGYEYILDNYLPVVKTTDGTQVWTKVNVSFTNYDGYNPDNVFIPDAWRDIAISGESGTVDMVSEYKFFYNVWDGKRWHRKQLTEGESVVLLGEDRDICGTGDAPYVNEGNKNHEWRIFINQETGEDEFIDIFAETESRLDELTQIITDDEEVVAAALNDLNSRFVMAGDDSVIVNISGHVTTVMVNINPDKKNIKLSDGTVVGEDGERIPPGLYFDGDFGTSTGEPDYDD